MLYDRRDKVGEKGISVELYPLYFIVSKLCIYHEIFIINRGARHFYW